MKQMVNSPVARFVIHQPVLGINFPACFTRPTHISLVRRHCTENISDADYCDQDVSALSEICLFARLLYARAPF